jgi:hypothetical protein
MEKTTAPAPYKTHVDACARPSSTTCWPSLPRRESAPSPGSSGATAPLPAFNSSRGCWCRIGYRAARTCTVRPMCNSKMPHALSAATRRSRQTTSSLPAPRRRRSGTTSAFLASMKPQSERSGMSSGAPPLHDLHPPLLLCWHIWKHRNSVIFDDQQPCLRRLLRSCIEATRLLVSRLPRRDAHVLEY